MYGYARVSTSDQDLTLQTETLTQYGCEMIRSEKVSGTSTDNRHELNTLLDFVREGDELVVTRIDRLARSVFDLQKIVRSLAEKGVALKVMPQPNQAWRSACR